MLYLTLVSSSPGPIVDSEDKGPHNAGNLGRIFVVTFVFSVFFVYSVAIRTRIEYLVFRFVKRIMNCYSIRTRIKYEVRSVIPLS